VNLYDLAALADAEEIAAWLGGEERTGWPTLSPADRRRLLGSWWFLARPGQRWEPGREFITRIEAGRGFGKNYAFSNTMLDAAEDPERWGGMAIVVGASPAETLKYCIKHEASAILPLAAGRAAAGTGDRPAVNLNDRTMVFPNPRGGGSGLTIQWAASSDPKSVRGGNKGLAWCDEFGVWYHRKTDEQGTNAWQALIPSIRAGRDPKVLISETPARRPEVLALQRDAERPECYACRAAALAKLPDNRWRGEEGREPWRLPTSAQVRIHPLLGTRSTIVVRECPACGAEVVARVRTIFGSTLDNPNLAPSARERARIALGSGTAAARIEFDPRGEVDAFTRGALVKDGDIIRLENCDPPATEPDRWRWVTNALGAREVVVLVDPAVTAHETSADSGVVVACVRDGRVPGLDQVVALQDASVRPDEVEDSGAPSSVWAPRAAWLAALWGAGRVLVETNDGGEEVVSLLRATLLAVPSEAEVLARLIEETGIPANRLGAVARRVREDWRRVKVETISRRSSKTARFAWFGETAARQQQAIAPLTFLDGARHWSPAIAQGAGYEPPREGATGGNRREKKDRFDAWVAAAQVLLGVRETTRGIVDPASSPGWLGKMSGNSLRPGR
jgi:phage terminase large subunit-like protein